MRKAFVSVRIPQFRGRFSHTSAPPKEVRLHVENGLRRARPKQLHSILNAKTIRPFSVKRMKNHNLLKITKLGSGDVQIMP
jgi:hypothetical protein